MTEPRVERRDPAPVVQALFNQAACSDLTLDVNGVAFHAHCSIMLPASAYLRRFVQWPSATAAADADDDDAGRAGSRSPTVIKISLPDLRQLAGNSLDDDDDDGADSREAPLESSDGFRLYLEFLYGVRELRPDRLRDVFAVCAVADYLLSADVVGACDRLLLQYDRRTAARIAAFSQRYPGLRALHAAKSFLASFVADLWRDPGLYALDPDHFADVVQVGRFPRPSLAFWMIAYYAAERAPDAALDAEDELRLVDAKRIGLFEDLFSALVCGWDKPALDDVVVALRDVRVVYGPAAGRDPTFVYRTLAERYLQLSSRW